MVHKQFHRKWNHFSTRFIMLHKLQARRCGTFSVRGTVCAREAQWAGQVQTSVSAHSANAETLKY